MALRPGEEVYLGDGLYAAFDGFQYRLRTPREDGNHIIFLEPTVLAAFDQFRADIEKKVEPDRGTGSSSDVGITDVGIRPPKSDP